MDLKKFEENPLSTVADYFDEHNIEFTSGHVKEYLNDNQIEQLLAYCLVNNIVLKIDTLSEAEDMLNRQTQAKSLYWDNILDKYVKLEPEIALCNSDRYTPIKTHLLKTEGPKKYKQKYWNTVDNKYEFLYEKDTNDNHVHWRTWEAQKWNAKQNRAQSF